jgi:hypothetical protein
LFADATYQPAPLVPRSRPIWNPGCPRNSAVSPHWDPTNCKTFPGYHQVQRHLISRVATRPLASPFCHCVKYEYPGAKTELSQRLLSATDWPPPMSGHPVADKPPGIHAPIILVENLVLPFEVSAMEQVGIQRIVGMVCCQFGLEKANITWY